MANKIVVSTSSDANERSETKMNVLSLVTSLIHDSMFHLFVEAIRAGAGKPEM